MENFEVIAKRFVGYLKNGNYKKTFEFKMNNGENNYIFGIKYISEFDNWTFVMGMYGDSGDTMKLLTFGDCFEDINWDNYVKEITIFLSKAYQSYTPVV